MCPKSELALRTVYIPSHKIIYFCNPKVAGSSIIQTLLTLDESISGIARADHNLPASRKEFSSRRDPSQFRKDLNGSNTFQFTFVRNPYTRILSCYRDKIVSQRQPRYAKHLGFEPDQTISFLEFLERIEQSPSHLMNRHWRPQSLLIPKAAKLNFVGRFENLAEDLLKLAEKLQTDSAKIVRMDSHRTGDKSQFDFKRQEVELINRIYYEDFRRFSYETM